MEKQTKKISFWHPASLICTCFGVGKIPFAPGTWGSLFGFPVLFVLVLLSAFSTDVFFPYVNFYGSTSPATQSSYMLMLFFMLFYLAALFALGVKCSDIYEQRSGKHDASEIVVDEVVGQIIAFGIVLMLSDYLYTGDDIDELVVACAVTSFVTFRLFDIVKRGPVGWIDRNVKGGMGVMLDDVVAGIMAGFASALIFLVI